MAGKDTSRRRIYGLLLLGLVAAWLGSPSDAWATTQTVKIANSADDAVELGTGTRSSVAINVNVWRQTVLNQRAGGFRFPGLNVPQGYTINSATLRAYVNSTADDIDCTIYGHASDNAPDFVANPYIFATVPEPNGRPRTAANIPVTRNNMLSGQEDFDVTSIVQELVNRPGWSSGNAVALLLIPKTGTILATDFHAWDGVPANAAELLIDFVPPTRVFYSVGTQASALYSGNASASSGTLTLASAASNNVGVGDEIRQGSSRYYITSRTSATVFSIQDSGANGGTPGATAITFGSQAITIFRAFNLLSAAESGSSDANHLQTADLVDGAFQLNWACYKDAVMDDVVTIDGYTTGANKYIRVYTPTLPNQVGTSQRHTGIARTGFRLRPTTVPDRDTIKVQDNHVRIEGLEIDGSLYSGSFGYGGVSIETASASLAEHHVNSNIIYSTGTYTGIYVSSVLGKVWNNVLHQVNNTNATLGALVMDEASGTGYFFNNTVYDHAGHGIRGNAGTLIARNNISMRPGGGYFDFSGAFSVPTTNVSSDFTAVGAGGRTNQTNYAAYFQNIGAGTENLHLLGDSLLLFGGYGADLDSVAALAITDDIDDMARDASQPDMGADEFAAATAVTLASFAARGFDGAVSVEWETAAELDNLGFHLYRGASADGPWERITASLIQGLGSSPEGKRYSFADRGLVNGQTYYYRLEDVDRSGRRDVAWAGVRDADCRADAVGRERRARAARRRSAVAAPGAEWKAHGNPADVALRVLQRSARGVTLELRTGGFYSQSQPDGSVRLHVPGYLRQRGARAAGGAGEARVDRRRGRARRADRPCRPASCGRSRGWSRCVLERPRRRRGRTALTARPSGACVRRT